MTAFYEPTRDPETFRACDYTRGPWDDRFQHGGPPCALLLGHVAGSDPSLLLARATFSILRPVPIAAVRVELTKEHVGRSTRRAEGVLSVSGTPVLEVSILQIRGSEGAHRSVPPIATWPAPPMSEPFGFSFFRHEVAYHRAIEARCVWGYWGSTPIAFWARPRFPLVDGRETRGIERVALLADAQSGMGVPLDPMKYSFVNPDLTLYLTRAPEGSWIGFDIRSEAESNGVGLSQSALRDAEGPIGRSAQSLVIAPRR